MRFVGAGSAEPAPGVIDAINDADVIVIAPSNPPLSIWPILAIREIRKAISGHPRVVAVSPLFGGKALKGPADAVMASLGLPAGNAGVVEAYKGIIDTLVIDTGDRGETGLIEGVEIRVEDTRIGDVASGRRLAEAILGP